MIEVPRVNQDAPPGILEISLRISDPESIRELLALPEGLERTDRALQALRIGLLAMRQATGAVDVDALRREGESILGKLQMQLNGHQAVVHERLEHVLREYFDPESGRFAERVERLVARDGELERVLRSQVGAEDSSLQRTLLRHLGPESALMKVLSPTESEGLVHSLEDLLRDALGTQRERIVAQFSLDNPEGALSRLVRELRENHENISEALEKRVGDVVGEFSLDREDSALSKLVVRVDEAQKKISREFSLDQESSALARMRREMLEVLEGHAKDDASFRESVLRELGELRGRKKERDASTRHGEDFETSFFEEIQARAQPAGDVATRTGHAVGRIPNKKMGDVVLELGPEHAAAGVRIVLEAKEDKSYTLAKAREEIGIARKNRAAQVGVFVFSAATAPAGLLPFQRLGRDLFLVWDASDPASDVWLEAGLEVARALCTRVERARADKTGDLESLDRAILAVEKQIAALDEIATASTSIERANDRIRERVRKSKKQILLQVSRLSAVVEHLRGDDAAPNVTTGEPESD